MLENASNVVSTTPPSAYFNRKIVPGIDIKNTLLALTARYYMMIGDYDKALAVAEKVDLSVKSSFNFDDNTRNPLSDAFADRNGIEPTDMKFGLPESLAPAANDKRVNFFFQTAVPTNNLGKAGYYSNNSSQIPVYHPSEMVLIKVEVYARKNDFTKAVEELNKVLTKSKDIFGVVADLPAYNGEKTQDALLTEIYRQRCIELYTSGLRFSDSRRFNRPGLGTAKQERSRNFFPYPFSERENNSGNVPADPAN